MHVPLFNKTKADEMLASWAKCAYTVAPPYEYYSKYNDHYRKQQTPTKETLDAVEYIGRQTAIKAIVAGHIHENSDGIADCGIRQITTAPLNAAAARIIEFI